MTAVHRGCKMASVQDALMYTDGDGVCPEWTLWDRFAGGTKCQYSGMIVTADFRRVFPPPRSGTRRTICLKGVVAIPRSDQLCLKRRSRQVQSPNEAYEYAPHGEDL